MASLSPSLTKEWSDSVLTFLKITDLQETDKVISKTWISIVMKVHVVKHKIQKDAILPMLLLCPKHGWTIFNRCVVLYQIIIIYFGSLYIPNICHLYFKQRLALHTLHYIIKPGKHLLSQFTPQLIINDCRHNDNN